MSVHHLTAADGIQWKIRVHRSPVVGPCVLASLSDLTVLGSMTAELKPSLMDDSYITLQLAFGQLEFTRDQLPALEAIVSELHQLQEEAA